MNFLRILSLSFFFTWIIFSFFYSKQPMFSFFIKGDSFSFKSFWGDSLQEEGTISFFSILSPHLSAWKGRDIFLSLKNRQGENFLEVKSSFVEEDAISGLTFLKEDVSLFSSSLGFKVTGSSFKWDKTYSTLEGGDLKSSPILFEWDKGMVETSFFSWDLVENRINLKSNVKGFFENEKD